MYKSLVRSTPLCDVHATLDDAWVRTFARMHSSLCNLIDWLSNCATLPYDLQLGEKNTVESMLYTP